MRPWEVLSVTWADNTAKVLSLQDKSRALATALVVLLFLKKSTFLLFLSFFFIASILLCLHAGKKYDDRLFLFTGSIVRNKNTNVYI